MNTDNKKLLKEFAAIYAASNRAKQAAVAELGRIDEKYKRLAEEEKKSLNELVESLDKQLAYYGPLLGNDPEVKAPKAEEPVTEGGPSNEPEQQPEPEEEPVIQDTLFPENNEPDENEAPAEPAPVAESPGEPAGVPASDAPAAVESSLDKEEDDKWNKRIESGELKEVEEKTEGVTKEEKVEEPTPEVVSEEEWNAAPSDEDPAPEEEPWPSMPEEWNQQ